MSGPGPRLCAWLVTGIVALIASDLLWAAPATSRPLDACYRTSTTRLDVGECLDRRLEEAEAALEAAATTLQQRAAALDRATGRAGAAESFEESERAFREYLDRHCAWISAMASPGTGAGDVLKDCAIRLTEWHTQDLRTELPPPRPGAAPAVPAAPATTSLPAGTIPGGEWRLAGVERGGRWLKLPVDPTVTLAVDANGMIAGRAFVNRYFGSAALDKSGRFRWKGAIGSTRMSGPPELMEGEASYLKLLGRVSRWRVKGDMLTLESDNGDVRLRYRR